LRNAQKDLELDEDKFKLYIDMAQERLVELYGSTELGGEDRKNEMAACKAIATRFWAEARHCKSTEELVKLYKQYLKMSWVEAEAPAPEPINAVDQEGEGGISCHP
jgi:hypothetical protein